MPFLVKEEIQNVFSSPQIPSAFVRMLTQINLMFIFFHKSWLTYGEFFTGHVFLHISKTTIKYSELFLSYLNILKQTCVLI